MKRTYNDPTFYYDENTGNTVCYIQSAKIPSLCFIGKAYCAPNDQEYKSRRIGENISYRRASVKAMRYILNQEAIPELKLYKDIYSTFTSSSKYNLASSEAKLIKRKINALEEEITVIKEIIECCKSDLQQYITTINMLHTPKKDKKD